MNDYLTVCLFLIIINIPIQIILLASILRMSSQCTDKKSINTVRRNKIENEQILNRETTIKVIKIVKNLHQMIANLFISQNNQVNFTQSDDTLINKTKISQINFLQTEILELEVEIKNVIKKWSIVQQKIKYSFNMFLKQFQQFLENEKYHKHLIQKLTKAVNQPLRQLSLHIQQFTVTGEVGKGVKNQVPQMNYLQKQNTQLKQYIKKLQIKYKHVLFQQKSQRESKNSQQSDQSDSGEYCYGIRRQAVDYPMRISVEILQRKVKELERENMRLKKSQNIDCMCLVEQLQHQIKALRMQHNSDIKKSRKLTQTSVQRANEEYDPYYTNRGIGKPVNYPTSREKMYKNIGNSGENYQTPSFQRVRFSNFQNNQIPSLQRKRQKSVPTQLKPSFYF